jgi:acyl-coenzyme A thioesterase PaaI-like protein
LAAVAPGEVHIASPSSKRLSQQHGYVHAGAMSSVAGGACGYAASSMAPPDCEVVPAELNPLRPAMGDRRLAIGTGRGVGKLHPVGSGERQAFSRSSCQASPSMQATIVDVS